MSLSITNRTDIYSNMYTPKSTKKDTSISNTSTCETIRNDNPTTALLGARLELPDENLKPENNIGQIQFYNGTHAEVYKTEDFSEENPVVNVYSKDNTTGEWTKTTVDLNNINKTSMNTMESFGVGVALEHLGKIKGGGALQFVTCFDHEMNNRSDYTYDDLFTNFNFKSMFEGTIKTQYKFGNMQGYLDLKRTYDAFFLD